MEQAVCEANNSFASRSHPFDGISSSPITQKGRPYPLRDPFDNTTSYNFAAMALDTRAVQIAGDLGSPKMLH
jgi:hypothetical protein